MKSRKLFILLANALCILAGPSFAYSPPVGIPNPADSFGGFDPIDTPTPDRSVIAPGWFSSQPRENARAQGDSHDCYYIDNNIPTATDSGNPYGHPDRPRRTIPDIAYTAGSYVEIHGDGGSGNRPYSSRFRPRGTGSADAPIWFVGIDAPVLSRVADIGGKESGRISYMVFDGIHWKEGGRLDIRPRFNGDSIDHLAFRRCVMRGSPSVNDTGVLVGSARLNRSDWTVQNVVFHECKISHYGNPADPDEECGLYPVFHVTNLWFLDGSIHHNAEDGTAGSHDGKRSSSGYYIGRTEIYDNVTNGIDIKQMGKVVISECDIHGHKESNPNNTGSGNIVIHYSGKKYPGSEPDQWKNYAEDVSILSSMITDSDYGVLVSSVENIRISGNTFHRINHSTDPWRGSSAYSTGAAIHIRDLRGTAEITGNNILECDSGIQLPEQYDKYSSSKRYFHGDRVLHGGAIYTCISDFNGAGISGTEPPDGSYWQTMRVMITGNIIANRAEPDGRDVYISATALGDNALDFDDNRIFSPYGEAISYGTWKVIDLPTLTSTTGHMLNGSAAKMVPPEG